MAGLLEGLGGPPMQQGVDPRQQAMMQQQQAQQQQAMQQQQQTPPLHVLANQLAALQQMVAQQQEMIAQLMDRRMNYDLQYQRNDKGQITGATVYQIPEQPSQPVQQFSVGL